MGEARRERGAFLSAEACVGRATRLCTNVGRHDGPLVNIDRIASWVLLFVSTFEFNFGEEVTECHTRLARASTLRREWTREQSAEPFSRTTFKACTAVKGEGEPAIRPRHFELRLCREGEGMSNRISWI